MMPRSSAACRRALLVILLAAALPAVLRADDARLAPLKDLDGSFPFTPPATLDAWKERAAEVRQRILVSQGLWPMPEKTPLNPSIHGTITKGPEAKGNEGTGGYTVSNVSFESAPGLFVTGNLYRPLGLEENQKVPAVLFAHGHWQNARHADQDAAATRKEIANGEERFEEGGRSRFQSLCVQLARMGCVVWQWDMLGNSDSQQLSMAVAHGFKQQRPEMNTPTRWGLYSARAESHLQSVMGLQTLNAIRSLDFLLSLPEVDPTRVAATGSSGGGTQTMILAAVDERVQLSFPVVMVSTSMQGGCPCENASLLRIGTGNVEFAATGDRSSDVVPAGAGRADPLASLRVQLDEAGHAMAPDAVRHRDEFRPLPRRRHGHVRQLHHRVVVE
jgi:dienelactone hydrolase